MYQGFEIIDFHVHFPIRKPWFPMLGNTSYKLLAPMIEQPIEDESIWPVREKCAELDIPVLTHFGIQGSAGGIA